MQAAVASSRPCSAVPQPQPRRAKMASIKPIPDSMHTVTPLLVCAGASDAIGFYKRAFGAVEQSRLPVPNGKLMHTMTRTDDLAAMLGDEAPEWCTLSPKATKGSLVSIHLYDDNADATADPAVKAGA